MNNILYIVSTATCFDAPKSSSGSLAKDTEIIKDTTQQNQQVKMFTYVIVTVDDKIESIKRCELCQLL